MTHILTTNPMLTVQKMKKAIEDMFGKGTSEPGSYQVTAITKGGEERIRTKINPNKKHGVNNTIIGYAVYKNGLYSHTLMK